MTRIVVAGAGIGGLATALALARGGCGVTVLERRPALAEFGAGIQLAPNATRVLADLGLLDGLRAAAVEPELIRIRRGRDAADLASLPLGRVALRRYGAPFLLLHRPDLQRLLAAAAVASGVTLVFDAGLAEAAPIGADPSVRAAGRDWPADGFVDARGWQGAAAATRRRTAWRALVPPRERDDRAPRSNLWLGPDTHLVHYPIASAATVNVVAITEEHDATIERGADLWSRPGDPAVLRRAFAGWHPDALRWLDPQVEWRCWPLREAAPSPVWSVGRRTSVGDAAHPMLPFLAQGASQAIEDAAALAAALRRQDDDVAAAFRAYEATRRPRAERVVAASRSQGRLYHLARPAADARDLGMRLLGSGALRRLDWLYGLPKETG